MAERYTQNRCINIDWFEVFAHEPSNDPRDADYYRRHGYVVYEREYGTRVYREMFVLEGVDGKPLLEIRRNPASQGATGIYDGTETHLRLVNRVCYFDDAVIAFHKFLDGHGYQDYRISRVDICLDFVKFDRGDIPADFVRRFFAHKYAKINQGNIHSHGTDSWTGQDWNSLSWGAKSSAIYTKFYNKTLELYDTNSNTYKKPYIVAAWKECGLIDDFYTCSKDGKKVDVWRLEFTIKSDVKNWVKIILDGDYKKKQSIRNTLECYYDRPSMLVIFASLATHYFHFKHYEPEQRKDRCQDKILFVWKKIEHTYKVGRNSYALTGTDKVTENYNRLIEKLRDYAFTHLDNDIRKACKTLIDSMQQEDHRKLLVNPWSNSELQQLLNLIDKNYNNAGNTLDVDFNKVQKLLNIKDHVVTPQDN